MVPIIEELEKYLGVKEVKKYKYDGIIQVEALEYMRGRNFHNCFMILDECQNATLDQICMFLTRIGQNSKCILAGDVQQRDLRGAGFPEAIEKLRGVENVGISQLYEEDIIRHEIIAKILAALKNN